MSSAASVNWNCGAMQKRDRTASSTRRLLPVQIALGTPAVSRALSSSSRPGMGASTPSSRLKNSSSDSAAMDCQRSSKRCQRIMASKHACGVQPITASFSSRVYSRPRRRMSSAPTWKYKSSVLNISPSMSKITARGVVMAAGGGLRGQRRSRLMGLAERKHGRIPEAERGR